MTISFFSNFLNHHQLPLCEEFIRLVGVDNFHFIATDRISDERTALGYEDMNERFPFVVKEYNEGETSVFSHKLAVSSDIAIFTPSAYHYCEERLKINRICFLYIERQFKRGIISLVHPRVFRRYFGYQRHRNAPLYILCAGSFVAKDLRLFGFPKDKCFKWGYFPRVESIDIDAILNNRDNSCFKILWCARFIPWKRPELALRLARDLRSKGYNFRLDMYGNGILLDKIRSLIHKWDLDEYVSIYGSVSNQVILDAMKAHNVLLVTSNKREGWGAVINEAMGNGCTVVASDDIGAVPYLIQNEINGYVFKSNSYKSLFRSIERLIIDLPKCDEFAKRSYHIISEKWTARTAAQNLLLLNDKLNGLDVNINDGPCSKA